MCLNSPSHGLALLKAGAKLRKLFGMSKLFAEKHVLHAEKILKIQYHLFFFYEYNKTG